MNLDVPPTKRGDRLLRWALLRRLPTRTQGEFIALHVLLITDNVLAYTSFWPQGRPVSDGWPWDIWGELRNLNKWWNRWQTLVRRKHEKT